MRWILWALLVLASPLGAQAAAAPAKPNFIIVFIDDMGYGDITPFNPATKNHTPRLEQMAREGMKLTSYYACPSCTPSRAELLTGCYAKRVSMDTCLWPKSARGLNPQENTIAELLKPLGYATMCIGKWHLGDQPEFLPTRQGFDHYFGVPYSNDMDGVSDGSGIGTYHHPPLPLLRDDKPIESAAKDAQNQLTERYTEEAIKFIKENQGKPFFLYIPHTAVHVPLHPGDQFRGRNGKNRPYADLVEQVDDSTGRIIDTVRELKLDENTLIFFTSDNGPWTLKQSHGGNPGPLRGGKESTYEGGMREPTIAWWPGHIPAGTTCDAVVGNIDLLPTFVKLAGGVVPDDRKIDGADISPILLGHSKDSPREAHYYFGGHHRLFAVRSGPWKLWIHPRKKDVTEATQGAADAEPVVLYNLDTDIGERIDVAAQHPDVVKRLQALADKMDKDLGATDEGPGVRPAGHNDNPQAILIHGP